MFKLISRTVLLAAFVSTQAMAAEPATPAPATAAPETAPVPVYELALAPGWSNWSWAKTDLSVELKGSARKPIKVAAGPYQALYLQHAAFTTHGLKQISLLIQGSAPDGAVKLLTLTDGKVNGDGKLIALSNTGWTKVVMPLVTLDAEDKLIDGIWLQNPTGVDLPHFYVTEIRIE